MKNILTRPRCCLHRLRAPTRHSSADAGSKGGVVKENACAKPSRQVRRISDRRLGSPRLWRALRCHNEYTPPRKLYAPRRQRPYWRRWCVRMGSQTRAFCRSGATGPSPGTAPNRRGIFGWGQSSSSEAETTFCCVGDMASLLNQGFGQRIRGPQINSRLPYRSYVSAGERTRQGREQ
jgi:hypothetical protein